MILTQEQEMIRDSMRAFAQERLAPFAAEWDRDHTFPAQALKELGELGALGMCVPEEWGGAGMDYMSLVLTLEEIAAGDGATSTIVSVQNSLPCGIINKYGTTVAENPLSLREWLVHAKQEAIDQAIYLQRAIEEIDAREARQAGKPEGWHACGNVGMEASE